MKTILKTINLFLKGFILGISMALPGISGGTLAFILGFYQKLIGEISKTSLKHLHHLFLCLSFKKKKVKQGFLFFRTTWDWSFLLPLIFGILCSAVAFVAFASPLIERHSLEFYSLICGLVLASIFKPFKDMRKSVKTFALFFTSLAINVFLFAFGNSFFLLSGDVSPLVFLPVGFLISSALVVPGLSGSYILVVFGLYEKTLVALRQGDFLIICLFLSGAILGVFSIAKLIHWTIKKYFDETMAILLGLILGSLYSISPLSGESLKNLWSFDTEKKIFLFYFTSSFFFFIFFSSFYEVKKRKKVKPYTDPV